MDCFYINLDSAKERRAQIERNFAERAPAHWRLRRFAAVDVAAVARMKVPGALRPAEKGCFISHRTILRECVSHAEPFLILEDDAFIGIQTFQIIDQSLTRRPRDDWDLIFTDICVPDLRVMIDFIRMRRRLDSAEKGVLLDLAGFPFAGSTAYLVNPASIQKLVGLLDAEPSLDMPYDLWLRKLVQESRIRAHVYFPFITTLSATAGASSIQPDAPYAVDTVWNAYRRLIWLERDVAAESTVIEALRARYEDRESDAFGVLIAAMMSDRLELK